jgi:hypothetical protein
MTSNIIEPSKILLSNKGYMKINDIELAELKSLTIKITPEMKEIVLLNSVTKGKIMTSITGKITFEINKIYSRFKPTVLECYKYLLPFSFSLEATVKNNNNEEESIYIGTCWLEGDLELFALKSDNDFLTEKYEANFKIESCDFTEIIQDDNEDWIPTEFSYT